MSVKCNIEKASIVVGCVGEVATTMMFNFTGAIVCRVTKGERGGSIKDIGEIIGCGIKESCANVGEIMGEVSEEIICFLRQN